MEMGGSSNAQDFKLTSNVNVSNFVSVKLSGRMDYKIWKAQMLCLIKSQALLHIIDDGAENPFPAGDNMILQYDQLIKGWIFGTMTDHVLNNYADLDSAREVWVELESNFGKKSGDSRNVLDVSGRTEDLRYMLASKVNVFNFISEKLSNHDNYDVWKTQMLCLIESHKLLRILDFEEMEGADGDPMTQKYDKLVKGWILGALNEQVLEIVTGLNSAADVWFKLRMRFRNPSIAGTSDETPIDISTDTQLFTFRKEFEGVPEIEDKDNSTLKKELYEAATEGCWWKAKSILKSHKDTATLAVTTDGNTILHLAVKMGHNYFVEKLLDFLKDGEEACIAKKNDMGRTALHIAAMVGNEYAAQLLIQKRNDLLGTEDRNGDSPFKMAYDSRKPNFYTCLIKSKLSYEQGRVNLDCYHGMGIISAILTKEYEIARTLLEQELEYDPGRFIMDVRPCLLLITLNFPTDLGFMESFIYPSFHDIYKKIGARGSLLFHSKFLEKYVDDISRVAKFYNNMCCSWLGKFSMILLVPIATLYPIFQLICLLILVLRLPFSMLYFLLWKVLAVIVPPIKNIEKKKNDYQGAKKILSFMCKYMGTSNDRYCESIVEAVRNDLYEVVDEILFMSPTAINCTDKKGHNIIQLSIINRSQKVYNLIYHIIERMRPYRGMRDNSNNSLIHLAGRLAPSFVLSRTTGAALQLQRELLWYEEVERLFSPLERLDENINEETPSMVFTKEHHDLMKQGESWIKTTAESCSITAALIVTVVFAAAITVPGGNQESGIPLFRKEIAFTIFAVSNAFSLFTATTSLLLFLSVLTTRFSEKDFLVSLPRKLILGLLTLFLSTTSMMVAFGAILFLVFCDQRPWMLAPIFAFSCLPLWVIVTVKVPLLVDLIKSTYFPIFGKQSYLDSCKVNKKNTIFLD